MIRVAVQREILNSEGISVNGKLEISDENLITLEM